tara:strand:- start:620 stop:799 length:180 start_codon:yes stop_codon:yes gene_type:complete
MTKEKGSAEIIITLEDGEITVRHGEDRTVLINWIAKEGDWSALISLLRLLKNMANGHEY